MMAAAVLVVGYILTHWWARIAAVLLGCAFVIAYFRFFVWALRRWDGSHEPQHKASRPRTSRSRAGKARAARRTRPPGRRAPGAILNAVRGLRHGLTARDQATVDLFGVMHDEIARERSARLAHSIGAGGLWPAPTNSGAAVSAPDGPGPGDRAPDGGLTAAAVPRPGAYLPAPIPHDGPWNGRGDMPQLNPEAIARLPDPPLDRWDRQLMSTWHSADDCPDGARCPQHRPSPVHHDDYRPVQTWHPEPPEAPWGSVPPVAALVAAVRGLPAGEYRKQLAEIATYRDERPLRDWERDSLVLKVLTDDDIARMDAERAATGNGGA